ncbi:MAG: UDP-3-O-(3-hydroxymyristoyl)glucosamine N-acyltransferase, partial [Synergistaceae bacterium]|nr:UDP-3-O-(3-hydroxymyristoyl)glucosamine N-acyltransferase [Synergistaceae bacterium]
EYFDGGRDGLITDNPRAALADVLSLFDAGLMVTGIDPKAEVSSSAKVSPGARICAFAYVGGGCTVGEGTVIEPHAVLVRNVAVGRSCMIHSGAVIGADGFGFERTPSGWVKIPQVGGVRIGDDVEIGACTTIDRGTISDTEIGSGTKIDNQVQIGHNVKIGRNCIICSMSGIAGSSILEDNVTLAVQAGITDHVRIGANAVIAGRSGVTNDIPADAIVSGFPARNHNDAKRALMLAADLPSIVKRLRAVERKNEA